MPEPTRNPRVERAQKRTFYNMTRRYGEQITLQKVDENEVDYTSGSRTRSYTEQIIRNAVYVPPSSQRKVLYTPAMMQAIRQFAWQGGAGQDVESTMFLIYQNDIKSWGEFDTSQRVLHRNKVYEVEGHQQFDGGIILNATLAKGSQ